MKEKKIESVLGIVAEYNPFHNGHLYHLKQSKRITNSKYVVAIVGNNFSQRGDCSIFDKWTKAKLVVENGVDLVIELPSIYSVSSAENFAYGAVSILNSLGIVDYLSFGSENGDIDSFVEVSNYIYNNDDFSCILKQELKNGNSYPKAMNLALDKVSNNKYFGFLTPNNILGLEYISVLKSLNSKMVPITIKRNNDFSSNNINKFSDISSATSIRKFLLSSENDFSEIARFVPENVFDFLQSIYKDRSCSVPTLNSFEKEILYILKRMSLEEIRNLPDVSEGLEYKIKEATYKSSNLDSLIINIKSKRYTLARIQRILVYALLGITKNDLEVSKNITPYARVLGFSSNGKELLSDIKRKNKDINLITSLKKFENSCKDDNLKRLIEIDMLSTQVYNSVLSQNRFLNDYTEKIIEIKNNK